MVAALAVLALAAPGMAGAASKGGGSPNHAGAQHQPGAAPAAVAADAGGLLGDVVGTLMFVRVVGVTAIEKAPTEAIKRLSAEVVGASAASLKALEAAVVEAGLGVGLPQSLSAEHAASAELLQSSFETQFEHEYLDMQIAAHRTAAARLKTADGMTLPPAIAPLVARIGQDLGKHLAALEDAKRQLPAM
jgi:predicted outer membrane protein